MNTGINISLTSECVTTLVIFVNTVKLEKFTFRTAKWIAPIRMSGTQKNVPTSRNRRVRVIILALSGDINRQTRQPVTNSSVIKTKIEQTDFTIEVETSFPPICLNPVVLIPRLSQAVTAELSVLNGYITNTETWSVVATEVIVTEFKLPMVARSTMSFTVATEHRKFTGSFTITRPSIHEELSLKLPSSIRSRGIPPVTQTTYSIFDIFRDSMAVKVVLNMFTPNIRTKSKLRLTPRIVVTTRKTIGTIEPLRDSRHFDSRPHSTAVGTFVNTITRHRQVRLQTLFGAPT